MKGVKRLRKGGGLKKKALRWPVYTSEAERGVV